MVFYIKPYSWAKVSDPRKKKSRFFFVVRRERGVSLGLFRVTPPPPKKKNNFPNRFGRGGKETFWRAVLCSGNSYVFLALGGKKRGKGGGGGGGGGVQLKKIPMSKAWRWAKTGRGGGGGEKKVNVSKKKYVCQIWFVYILSTSIVPT